MSREIRHPRRHPAATGGTSGIVLSLFILSAAPLRAADPETPPARPQGTAAITLSEAIQRAFENDSNLAVLGAAVASAKEKALAARDLRDPELRLSYGQGAGDETRHRIGRRAVPLPDGAAVDQTTESVGKVWEDSDMYRVGIRVFPPNPWERAAGVSAMTAEMRAAEADLAAARWSVAMAIHHQAAELNYLERDQALLLESVRLQGEMLQSVKSRAAQGQAIITDSMLASRRYLAAISERDQAARRLQEVRRTLAAAVNLPATALSVRDIPMTAPPATNMQAEIWEQKALENRLEIRALSWRAAAAKAAFRQARSACIPWFRNIDATYGWSKQDTTGNTVGSELAVASGILRDVRTDIYDAGKDDEWRIDAAVTIPVFSWMNHADDQKWAEYKQAALKETEAIKQAAREVRDALAQWQTMQADWRRYVEELDPMVRQMEEAVEGIGGSSALTPEQVIDIKLQIVDARRSKLRTAYDFQVAALTLQAVLGTPLTAAF